MEIKSNARKKSKSKWKSFWLEQFDTADLSKGHHLRDGQQDDPASSQKAKNKIKTGRLISGRTCLSPAKSRWGPPSGVQWKTEQNRQKIYRE